MPIGYEMAEKNANTQTDRHFRIYISRDVNNSKIFTCTFNLICILFSVFHVIGRNEL